MWTCSERSIRWGLLFWLSIGVLADLFDQVIAADEELIKERGAVRPKRNIIAHRTLLMHVGVEHNVL